MDPNTRREARDDPIAVTFGKDLGLPSEPQGEQGFERLWHHPAPPDDPLHRCIVAVQPADLEDDPRTGRPAAEGPAADGPHRPSVPALS
ncbi:hypothetical protein [Streptomyces sp. NPDC050164]|uniref:hypothetical protein n=1 Tax=Streptomyces sp. NPDC050164 TaxID=3365605 RepID=UPI003799537A